ncbi:protein IQ-DOMAIN 18-like [Cornus florida]|uniref:protein IQ-DOMAIN 18-like n=1 Tax=Cornus florida TaxID=4283 RepID=UPI0028981DCA|nr:protein IQ-DOMAIN 18-like [Cornus florida]
MGKTGVSSWLSQVKKAFRSPTKGHEKKSSRRREEHEQEEEEKKREKRRWIFRKSSLQETTIQHNAARDISATANSVANPIAEAASTGQRRAVAVAMATTAAAEAAVATAQAAVEIIRLTGHSIFVRQHFAAIVIQTAFRGYLAKRALRALKGLVKLQALVRGHNVRKRAKMTLQCMQALVRVQARVCDQRKRLSYEGSSIGSMSSDPNSLWESHLANRMSISRDGRIVAEDWNGYPHTTEEFQAMVPKTKEAALKREKALAHAFSHQMWRSGKDQFLVNEEIQEKTRSLDQWTTRRQWERTGRASCDERDPIKTVEIDVSQPYSYSDINFQRSQNQHHHYQHQKPNSNSVASPLHRAHNNFSHHSPNTPKLSKIRPIQVHSASPRCLREERNYRMAQTPNLGSTYCHGMGAGRDNGAAAVPSYMAATASAKARIRSQSAPKQRPLTPEREKMGSAKKRLSFPVPDPYNSVGNNGETFDHNLRSPSCKGIQGGKFGMEQRSNMSSCYTDSLGDEISPPSSSDLRRWLR